MSTIRNRFFSITERDKIVAFLSSLGFSQDVLNGLSATEWKKFCDTMARDCDCFFGPSLVNYVDYNNMFKKPLNYSELADEKKSKKLVPSASLDCTPFLYAFTQLDNNLLAKMKDILPFVETIILKASKLAACVMPLLQHLCPNAVELKLIENGKTEEIIFPQAKAQITAIACCSYYLDKKSTLPIAVLLHVSSYLSGNVFIRRGVEGLVKLSVASNISFHQQLPPISSPKKYEKINSENKLQDNQKSNSNKCVIC